MGSDNGKSPLSALPTPSSPTSAYAVNSKIMVVAVAVLFAVVIFILFLHIYAKWFWRTAGSMHPGVPSPMSWRRRRRAQLDFMEQNPAETLYVLEHFGLDRSIVESLPTFVYTFESMKDGLECAVCLEDFEEKETGRTLPKCNHSFHIDCIDMWFHSHSTCPLCRTSARPETDPEKPVLEQAVEAGVFHYQASAPSFRRSSRSGRSLSLVSLHLSSLVNGTPGDQCAAPAAGQSSAASEGLAEPEAVSGATASQLASGGGQLEPDEASTTERVPQKSAINSPKVFQNASVQYPANVLFWGNQSQINAQSSSPQGQEAGPRSFRAPYSVAIEIPRASDVRGTSEGSSAFSTPKSPLDRLKSFGRLLSRGKSVGPSTSFGELPSGDAEQGSPSTQL